MLISDNLLVNPIKSFLDFLQKGLVFLVKNKLNFCKSVINYYFRFILKCVQSFGVRSDENF